MKRVETKVATPALTKVARPRLALVQNTRRNFQDFHIRQSSPSLARLARDRSRNQIARTQTFTRFTFAGIALSRQRRSVNVFTYSRKQRSLAAIYDNGMRGDS